MGTVQKLAYFLLSCGLLLCVLIAFERPAYAYVDPGSGLFLLQGVSSAFLGVLYVIRRKLKLAKNPKKKHGETAEEIQPTSEAIVPEMPS